MPVFLPPSTSAATTDDLIEETRRHLGAPETLNQLAALDASQTTVTFQRTVKGVSEGSLISVDLETLYVWSVDSAAQTAEVRRGHQGSTPAVHVAGSLARVSPGHTDFAILRALNAELDALTGAGLHAMVAVSLTTSETTRAYDLVAEMSDVYAVAFDADSDANTWPEVTSWAWHSTADTVEFPSGNMLRLDTPVPSGRTLRVLVKAPLGRLTALGQDAEATTGLRASALDLPPLGAAWHLVAGTEIERNQTLRQGDSRRAQEVPPGAKMRSTLQLQQRRQQRLREELANQARLWPSRSR